MRKRRFPKDVARFFNPHKSGTNAEFDKSGRLTAFGTHQREKAKQCSYIPVYQGKGPANATIDKYGSKVYVQQGNNRIKL